MIKIGMMIGGRYELLEKIGIGGTSEVYKVKDFKLNRFGAAKILKQEFWHSPRNCLHHAEIDALDTTYSAVILL